MNQMLEARLRVQLARHEGYRRWPYQDSEGNWTIGIGHLMEKGVSDAVVEQMFLDDLAEAEQLRNAWPFVDTLSEARQGVCFNMAFNLGVDGFMEFVKMRAALEAGDYDRAAQEMLDSQWANQVQSERVRDLVTQMQTNQWALR